MQSQKLKRLFRAVSATALAGGVLIASPVLAQDVTWVGGTNNYNTSSNWSPVTDPTLLNTATFSNSGSTLVDIIAPATVDHILFNGTTAYTLNNSSVYNVNGIGTLGITNESTVAQIINNTATGSMFINNGAAIDGGVGVTLNNQGALTFSGEANAGTSSTAINNLGGTSVFMGPAATNATLTFNNNSSAGSAAIANNAGNVVSSATGGGTGGDAIVNFNDNSSAGSAITNNAGDAANTATGGDAIVNFNDNSTAATVIANNAGDSASGGTGGDATVNFNDSSSVGSAAIANRAGDAGSGGTGGDATVNFNDDSRVGSAVITNRAGDATTGGTAGDAIVNFNDNATVELITIANSAGDATNAGTGGDAIVNFNADSSAGSPAITNSAGDATNGGTAGDAIVNFNDNSTAATAITNSAGDATNSGAGGDAIVNFNGDSSAGSAATTNRAGDATYGGIGGDVIVNFNDDSSAGSAAITNRAGDATNSGTGGNVIMNFNADSSAGSAAITNRAGDGAITGVTGGDVIVNFNGDSRAGSATITNTGVTSATAGRAVTAFTGTSTAATANITNNSGGATTFSDTADAGVGAGAGNQAQITNDGTGSTTFLGNSSAGTANIINQNGGITYFTENSTAANALITNNTGSTLSFSDTSDAGIGRTQAIVNNNGGTITFSDTADAGSAGTAIGSEGVSIRNQAGGTVFFTGDSTADNATIVNDSDVLNTAVVNISGVGGVDSSISIGSLSGSGNVILGSNNLSLGNVGNDDVIGGAIIGATGSSLTKIGTGALTLNGDATATETYVNGGALILNGTLTTDNVTVNTDGTIRGISRVSGNLLNNGGTIDAGSEVIAYYRLETGGDLVITGDDSILNSRINGEFSNLVIALGTVNLDGQVRADVDPNGTYLVNNEYLLAWGLQGRNGEFDGVVPAGSGAADSSIPDFLELAPGNGINGADGLFYETDRAYLLLRRNSLSDLTAGNAYSGNRRSLLGSYNGVLGSGDPLSSVNEDLINNFILNGDGALDQAGGDALTVFPVASQMASDRFNARMRNQSLRRVIELARIAEGKAPRMVYSGTRYSQLLNSSSNSVVAGAAQRRSNLWATIARAHDDGDGDGNGPGFEARATEFQVGVDRSISERTFIGLSLGKSDGKVDVTSRAAEGDLDTTSVGVYLRHEGDSFYASGSLSYSRHDIESRRFTGIGEADADFDGRTLGLQAEVGKRTGKGSYSIEPNMNLHLANTRQDSFTESGPGGLRVGSTRYNTRRLGVGVRIVNRDAAARIRPFLSLGYQREFGDTQAELTNQLTGLSAFGVDGTDLGKNIWTARLGADARVNDRFSVVGEIGASWRKNQDSRYIYGGVKYGW